MIRKPLFSFDDVTATGLDDVPVNSVVAIEDFDGNGNPRYLTLINIDSITDLTTVQTLLDNPSWWVNITDDIDLSNYVTYTGGLNNADTLNTDYTAADFPLTGDITGDANLFLRSGLYKFAAGTLTNIPDIALSGTITVIASDPATVASATQLLMTSENTLFSRVGDGTSTGWGTWRQYGSMTFDSGTSTLTVTM